MFLNLQFVIVQIDEVLPLCVCVFNGLKMTQVLQFGMKLTTNRSVNRRANRKREKLN